MSLLEVPGARLYHETRGSGPLLVMIPGAMGTLESSPTWVTTSPSTTPSSPTTGTASPAARWWAARLRHRLDTDTDTDDVGQLIEHLGATPAAVFGTSSGAVVAAELDLDALQRRAERIVLLAGQDCRDYPAYPVNVELGRILRRDLVENPGGHVAAGTFPLSSAASCVTP